MTFKITAVVGGAGDHDVTMKAFFLCRGEKQNDKCGAYRLFYVQPLGGTHPRDY